MVESHERQTVGHGLLVLGVYIVGLAHVDDYRLTRMRQAERGVLRIAQRGPAALRRCVDSLHEIGQLNPIERHLRPLPLLSPVVDHGREEAVVLLGTVGIVLALIPDDALDAITADGGNHSVVETRGILVGIVGHEAFEVFDGRDAVFPRMLEDGNALAAHADEVEIARAVATAATVVVDDFHGQLVLACLEHAGRYGVGALDGKSLGFAYALAVDPGHVVIVYHAHVEGGLLAGQLFGHIKLGGGPYHAVHLGERVDGPQSWYFKSLPVALVKVGAIPAIALATLFPYGFVKLGFEHLPTLGLGVEVGGAHLFYQRVVFGERLYRLGTHPGLDVGASPRGVDDAHGAVEPLGEFAGKEVAHGGEVAHRLGCRYRPATHDIGLGSLCHRAFHREHSDAAVVGRERSLLGVVGAAEAELHVGLAARYPYLAHEDVAHGQALLPCGHGHGVGPAIVHRRQHGEPCAVFRRAHGGAVVVYRHRHLLTLVGPAPYVYCLAGLYHHVIGYHCRQLQLCRYARDKHQA